MGKKKEQQRAAAQPKQANARGFEARYIGKPVFVAWEKIRACRPECLSWDQRPVVYVFLNPMGSVTVDFEEFVLQIVAGGQERAALRWFDNDHLAPFNAPMLRALRELLEDDNFLQKTRRTA